MAEGLLNLVLGWMQWIYKWLWSMLASFGENEFMPWFSNNWLMIAVVLVLIGLAVDFTVYLVRWQPYFFWRMIAKDKRGGRPVSREEAARNRDKYAGYRRALGLDEDYNARFYKGNYYFEDEPRKAPEPSDRYGGYRRGIPKSDAYAAKTLPVTGFFGPQDFARIHDDTPRAPVSQPVVVSKPRRVLRRPAKLSVSAQYAPPESAEKIAHTPRQIAVKAIDEPEQVSIKIPAANLSRSKHRQVWTPPEDDGNGQL